MCFKINQALSNAKNIMFNGIGADLLEPSFLSTALIPGMIRRYMTLLYILTYVAKGLLYSAPNRVPKYRTRLILVIFLVDMRLELAGKLISA
ncbi:hypothetical protein FDB50_01665 [Clostridium botulinum]|uniref:Uncharacterized protein n=1 Tax=Clostridium botulinum TaxID=1491 RepID=A0A846JNG7_CLOBO|nr:hypothetical protein [Clostridium botulinum]NFN34710.1 hypothetical protein [Clostridium botulinum]